MQHTTNKEVLSSGNDVLISPLNGAETLFLGAALGASEITARSLLEKLQQNSDQHNLRKQNQRSSRGKMRRTGSFHTAHTRGSNISVDEFMSCVENASDIDSIGSDEHPSNSHFALRPSSIHVKTTEDIKDMSIVVPTPTEDTPVEGKKMMVDAAEVVYGKAKDIFAWGKSVPVVGFFVGTSEAVAGKALGVVGTDLSQVDGKIESELTKLDKGVLNPAIEAIAKILIGVAGKSEAAIKPIIGIFLKPLGLLIKSEANEESPEVYTDTPEVTVEN
jgi:hypothetical protein